MGHNSIILSLNALQKFKHTTLNADHPPSDGFVGKSCENCLEDAQEKPHMWIQIWISTGMSKLKSIIFDSGPQK